MHKDMHKYRGLTNKMILIHKGQGLSEVLSTIPVSLCPGPEGAPFYLADTFHWIKEIGETG